jgi:hypothetical protein
MGNNKDLVKDVLFSLPIAIFLAFFIIKFAEMTTTDLILEEKIKKSLLISIIASIIGLALAIFIFSRGSLKNRAVKYGLILASSILLINSILFNWELLSHEIKLAIIGFILLLTVGITYKYKFTNDDDNQDDNQDDNYNG